MSKVLYSKGDNGLVVNGDVSTGDAATAIGVSVSRTITSDGKSMYHVDVTSTEDGLTDLTDYRLKVFIDDSTISTGTSQGSQASKSLTTVSLGETGGSHEAEFPKNDSGNYVGVSLIIRINSPAGVDEFIWQAPIVVEPAVAFVGTLSLANSSKNQDVSLALSGLGDESLDGQLADGLSLSLNISEATGLAMVGGVVTDTDVNNAHVENTNMKSVELPFTSADVSNDGVYTISSLATVLGQINDDDDNPIYYFDGKNDAVFEVIATVMSEYNDNVATVSAIVSPNDHPSNVEGLAFTTVEETNGDITVSVNANAYYDEDHEGQEGDILMFYAIVSELDGIEADAFGDSVVNSNWTVPETQPDEGAKLAELDHEFVISKEDLPDTTDARYLVIVAIFRSDNPEETEEEQIARAIHQSAYPSIIHTADHPDIPAHGLAFNLLVTTPSFTVDDDENVALATETGVLANSAMNSKQIVLGFDVPDNNGGMSSAPSSVTYAITHGSSNTTASYNTTDITDENGRITGVTITPNNSEGEDKHLALGDAITVTPTITYAATVEAGVVLGGNVASQDRSGENTSLAPTGVVGNVGVTQYVQELEPVNITAVRVVPELHDMQSTTDEDSFMVTLNLPAAFEYEDGSKASEISTVGFGGFKSTDLVLKVTISAESTPISESGGVVDVIWTDSNIPTMSGVEQITAVSPSEDGTDTEYLIYISGENVMNSLSNTTDLQLTFTNIMAEHTYTIKTQFYLKADDEGEVDLTNIVVLQELEGVNYNGDTYNIVANGDIDSLASDEINNLALEMVEVPAYGGNDGVIAALKDEQSNYDFSWANLKKTYGGDIVQEDGAGLFTEDGQEFLAFPNVTDNYAEGDNVNMIKILMCLDNDGTDEPILALHTGEAANNNTYNDGEAGSEDVKLIDDLVYANDAHFAGVCLSNDGSWIMVKLGNSSMLTTATPFKIEVFNMLHIDNYSQYELYRDQTGTNYVKMNKAGMKLMDRDDAAVPNVLVDDADADVEYSLSIVDASEVTFQKYAKVEEGDTTSITAYAYFTESDFANYSKDAEGNWIDTVGGGVIDHLKLELVEFATEGVNETVRGDPKYIKPYLTTSNAYASNNLELISVFGSPDGHEHDLLVTFDPVTPNTMANLKLRVVPVVDYNNIVSDGNALLTYNNNTIPVANHGVDEEGKSTFYTLTDGNVAGLDDVADSARSVAINFNDDVPTYSVELVGGASLPDSSTLELYVEGRRLVDDGDDIDYTSTDTGFAMTAEKADEWYTFTNATNGVLPITVKLHDDGNNDVVERVLNLSVLVSDSEGAGHSMDIVKSMALTTFYYKFNTEFRTGDVTENNVYVTHNVSFNHDSGHTSTPDSITLHGSLNSAISSSDDVDADTTVDTSLLYTHGDGVNEVSYSVTMKTASSDNSNLEVKVQKLSLTRTINGGEPDSITSGAYTWSQLVANSLALDFVSVHGDETLTIEVTGSSTVVFANAEALQIALNGNTYRESEVTVTIQDDTTSNSIVLDIE